MIERHMCVKGGESEGEKKHGKQTNVRQVGYLSAYEVVNAARVFFCSSMNLILTTSMKQEEEKPEKGGGGGG